MASSSSNPHSSGSTPPRRHTFFSQTPKYTSEASSSDGGRSLEDQRYDSSPMDVSRASSPLYNEKEHAESLLVQWQQSQKGLEPSPFSAEGAALASRRNGRIPSSSTSPSESPRLLAKPLSSLRDAALRVSRTPRRSSAKFRWALRILGALVAIVFLSAFLPGSRLTRWGSEHGYHHSAKPSPLELLDDPNQRLAAGTSWGWSLPEKLKHSPPGGDSPTPAQQESDAYDFAYPPTDHEAAGLYPQIPCQLDPAVFGRTYKLTPQYRYARRYVTARAVPPELDRPDGFDPKPRRVDQSIITGWNDLGWVGQSIEELCSKHTDLEAKLACKEKEKTKKAARQAREQASRAAKQDPELVEAVAAAKLGDKIRSRDATAKDDEAIAGKRALAATDAAANVIALDSCSSSLEPLELPTYPVPRTRTQPHNLVLGLASIVDRVLENLPELSFSFAYSNLHIILNLPPHPRMGELRRSLKARGIRATIIESIEEDYLRRWAELPALLRDFSDPDLTEWAIVADDDTFFFSMPKVLKMLDKYDPDKPHYLGAMTEDWRQSGSGMIGYGGGGVFLSMPLLDQLTEHWPRCKESGDPADHRLANCIYSNTHTRLSIEFALMQADLHGDIRGVLESGREIATMHHWKTWNTGFDPRTLGRASVPCGSECVLQRFLLDSPDTNMTTSAAGQGEKFLFVHGLSLTLYPDPLPDFGRAEVTWRSFPDSQFGHALGPTRPKIREGRPLFARTRELAHRSKASHFQRRALEANVDADDIEILAARDVPIKGLSGPSGGHWKESWMLEDVRLDVKHGNLPHEWDGDGRGIREIYIKRANRPKGYVSAGEVDQEALAEDDDLLQQLAGLDADEEQHRDLETAVKGLIGKLFGYGKAADKDRLVAEEIAREEIALEEQDSVIELIWV